MIVEYYPTTGEIFHVVQDPVPNELLEVLVENDCAFLSISPRFGPDVEVHSTDAEGNQIVDLVQGPHIPFNVSPITQYVDLEIMQVVDRPALAIPEKVDIAVGQGVDIVLPLDPFTINFDGEDVSVTDKLLQLDPEMPATYTLKVNHFPYQRQTLTVVVHEA